MECGCLKACSLRVLFKGTVYCLSSPPSTKAVHIVGNSETEVEEWPIFSPCMQNTGITRGTKNVAVKDLPRVFRLRMNRDIFILSDPPSVC